MESATEIRLRICGLQLTDPLALLYTAITMEADGEFQRVFASTPSTFGFLYLEAIRPPHNPVLDLASTL
jgi:hypothetical protein